MSDAAALTFVVAEGEHDRLDAVVARRFPGASRRRLGELFAAGAVRVDGKVARKGDRARPGATVEVAQAPATADALRVLPDPAAAERLVILHADDERVVVAKPPGMPSQPLRAGELGTAASGIVARFPECAGVADDPRDGGLVHRLDIGTSGALVAARTREAWQRLRAAFGAGEVDKTYLALTEAPPIGRGCDEPLAQRGRRVVVDHTDGLEASTTWHVERAFGERRLVRCSASTGRMHQIRVHLATCGAPIVGDVLYGGQPFPGLVDFFLHAAELRLPTPAGPLAVVAPLPPDRAAVLAVLEAGP
ncbi:MAG TPA: RluA family pseudouridine synthase [Kofleriaceae bacterium]|nr:RluA family pseudouridine synthase [Kofleriaceae bacterium]